MANTIVLLDTNVVIDYFRKTIKAKTFFHKLASDTDVSFAISVITHFEILRGINEQQEAFWWQLLKDIEIQSYYPAINYTAVQIQKQLRKQRKSITIEDLLIASTAVHLQIPLATLNAKHFEDITELTLITNE